MLKACAFGRLYHCSRLVHADLSEYNLLLCPSWQVSKDPICADNARTLDDQSLNVVMIDFGQAVEREHPNACDLLKRDIQTVRTFFVKKGIQTLSVDDTHDFVLADFPDEVETKMPSEDNDDTWRHNIPWDDSIVIHNFLSKLEARGVLSITDQFNT